MQNNLHKAIWFFMYLPFQIFVNFFKRFNISDFFFHSKLQKIGVDLIILQINSNTLEILIAFRWFIVFLIFIYIFFKKTLLSFEIGLVRFMKENIFFWCACEVFSLKCSISCIRILWSSFSFLFMKIVVSINSSLILIKILYFPYLSSFSIWHFIISYSSLLKIPRFLYYQLF